MRNAFSLQLRQDSQHLLYEIPYLLDCKDVDMLPSKGNVLMQVHLVFLHEEQQRPSFLDLFFLLLLCPDS